MRIVAVLSIPCGLFAWFALQIGAVANGQLLQGSLPWLPTLGIALSFRLDGLGLLFALLISGIGALVLLYASSYLHDDPHLGRFYGFILAFMLAMLGTVLAGDLITLFVFWELTSLCSFVLIGFDHQQEASRKAALQALLVTGAGGLALLGGIILLGQMAGSLELSTLLASGDQLRSHPLYLPVLLLVLAGAFTKSAQFPFQFWLPNAMAAPTPVQRLPALGHHGQAGGLPAGPFFSDFGRHRQLVHRADHGRRHHPRAWGRCGPSPALT